MRLPPPLLALSPGSLRPGTEGHRERRLFVAAVRAARSAGLEGVLLREPALSDRTCLELARSLREVMDDGARAGWLGIHDRPHLAAACGADGVHLGFRSLEPQEARRVAPASCAMGRSTHEGDDPERELAVDYVFRGPVHETPSKEGWLAPIGLEGLERAARGPAPVWAIGGLRPAHTPRVLQSGARGIAVLSGILSQEDPAAATTEYLASFGVGA